MIERKALIAACPKVARDVIRISSQVRKYAIASALPLGVTRFRGASFFNSLSTTALVFKYSYDLYCMKSVLLVDSLSLIHSPERVNL